VAVIEVVNASQPTLSDCITGYRSPADVVLCFGLMVKRGAYVICAPLFSYIFLSTYFQTGIFMYFSMRLEGGGMSINPAGKTPEMNFHGKALSKGIPDESIFKEVVEREKAKQQAAGEPVKLAFNGETWQPNKVKSDAKPNLGIKPNADTNTGLGKIGLTAIKYTKRASVLGIVWEFLSGTPTGGVQEATGTIAGHPELQFKLRTDDTHVNGSDLRIKRQNSDGSEQLLYSGYSRGTPFTTADGAHVLLNFKGQLSNAYRTIDGRRVAWEASDKFGDIVFDKNWIDSLPKAGAKQATANGDHDPTVKPSGLPKPPTEYESFIFTIRTQEEADLVANMQAQGMSAKEIMAALDDLRANRRDNTSQKTMQEIDTKINAALQSENPGTKLEGKVGKALRDAGFNVMQFQQKIGKYGSIGEIDVSTDKAIIEVFIGRKGKLQSIEDKINIQQLNPRGKPVILYAPNYQSTAAKNIINSGAQVCRNIEDLINVLNRLGGK
jgi:hypothetical protein